MKIDDLPAKDGLPYCPKCGAVSGDTWVQCDGACPIDSSPHYDPKEDYHRD